MRALRGSLFVALQVALLGGGACVSPAPLSTGRSDPLPAPARDPIAEPWIVGPSTGEVRQRLVVEAELRSRVDTIERVDSLRSLVEATTSRIVSSGAWRLSGLITAFRVGADSLGGATPSGLTLPHPFSAELGGAGSQPRLLQSAGGECSAASAAAQVLRELWVSPPSRLSAGLVWGDSARYTICRDSIPLTVTSHREYRVTGAERRGDTVVVLVDRTSRSQLEGSGLQFGETITLSGEGTGLAHLTVLLAGGWVLDAQGESETTLRLIGRRRTQELRQLARFSASPP